MSELEVIISPTSHNDPHEAEDLLELVASAKEEHGSKAKILVATENTSEVSKSLRSAIRKGNTVKIDKILSAISQPKFLEQAKAKYRALSANSVDVVSIGGTFVVRALFPYVAYQMLQDTAKALGLEPLNIEIRFDHRNFFKLPPIIYPIPEPSAIEELAFTKVKTAHSDPVKLMFDLFTLGISQELIAKGAFSVIEQRMRMELEYLSSSRGFLFHARDHVMAYNIAGVIISEKPNMLILNIGAAHAIPQTDFLQVLIPGTRVRMLREQFADSSYLNLLSDSRMYGSDQDICYGILTGNPQRFEHVARDYLKAYAERLASQLSAAQGISSPEWQAFLVSRTLERFMESREGHAMIDGAVKTISSHLQASNREIVAYLNYGLAKSIRDADGNPAGMAQRRRVTR